VVASRSGTVETALEYKPQDVAETGRLVARAIRDGEDPFIPIRDFVDDFNAADIDGRRRIVVEEPPLTGDPRFDAYLAAMVELFSLRNDIPPPAWVEGKARFLDRSWFREPREYFWPTALLQTPLPFRRRLVFIEESEFDRA
jgi:hypothetical protein